MTKEKQTKNTKKTEKKSESKFYLHELREHSQGEFGVKPEVLDGVFLNAKEIQFTKSEVKKRIEAFLKKPVNKKGVKK